MTRRGLIASAAGIGGLGAVATAIGFAVAPAQAAFSYLTAWTFALSIAVGALIFLMIGHAVGARWTIVLQRFTEAVVGSLPVLAVLFVPIAWSARALYPWVAPSPALGPDALARLAHKAPYLNLSFWTVRAAIFLGIWIAIGELLARWSAPFPAWPARPARVLSAAGLPAIGLTLTFAAFDWLMSLTPQWYSTIFGLVYFAGGFVAALALIAVIANAARRVPEVATRVRASHTGALGRLMFAFLVFWAYMELSQGLIIWIANKPDEVPWYVARGAGQWGGVFTVLVVGHFVLPCMVLLSRPLKRRPVLLAIAGAWLVAMHYLDVYWLVMPALHRALAVHWLDLAAPCAVLGIATAIAAARTRTRVAIATDDPRVAAAVGYEGS
ncbi:MAG TPA: hypothetical protein VH165_09175 [Kofleriaceae bacterium]|nr:hypothetical protein [Kofleriaceae bacterium]